MKKITGKTENIQKNHKKQNPKRKINIKKSDHHEISDTESEREVKNVTKKNKMKKQKQEVNIGNISLVKLMLLVRHFPCVIIVLYVSYFIH